MIDAPPPTVPRIKSWYRKVRSVTQVIGTLTAVVTLLTPVIGLAYDQIYGYRSACAAKGLELRTCIAGSLGIIDIESLLEKDRKIEILRAELKESSIRIAHLEETVRSGAAGNTKTALAEAQDALKKANEDLAVSRNQAADLARKYADATEKYTVLRKSIWGMNSSSASGVTISGRPPARPNANTFSTSIWPSGTIPHGETKQAKTVYGTLQCTGGNTNTGAARSCIWL